MRTFIETGPICPPALISNINPSMPLIIIFCVIEFVVAKHKVLTPEILIFDLTFF